MQVILVNGFSLMKLLHPEYKEIKITDYIESIIDQMKINLTKYEIKATPRKIEGCNQPVSPIKEPVIEAYKHYHVYTKVSAQCVGCKQCNSRYVCSCKGYHLCPECYKTHISEQNDIRGYTHIYKNEQSDLKYEQYVLIYIEHENSNLPIKWLKSISRILLIICEVEILTSLTLFRFNKINNIKQTSQLNQSSTAYLLKQLFNQLETPEEKLRKLGQTPIFKLLLQQSIPNVVSLLSLSMYQIIDSIFIGNYIGEVGLAAQAIFSAIEYLSCTSLPVAFSIGAVALIGPALGKNDLKGANIFLTQYLYFVIFYVVLVPVVFVPFLTPFLMWLGCAEGEMLRLAKQYALVMLKNTKPFVEFPCLQQRYLVSWPNSVQAITLLRQSQNLPKSINWKD
ncbi:Na+_driven multidrug efflux pump [Hexamita inflata]|uniref:Na+ driven multidrug efflux pump n=1 Tax=Hexamita inflata TaxID=28002 RepID=A0AA86RFL5_9EUKA|nr:Na+ driven multidrug efflux pump [Hexamita inflata]